MAARAQTPWWQGLPVVDEPATAAVLRGHLVDAHAMPVEVLDAHSPDEWATWHAAEHKVRHPAKGENNHGGHLAHTHPAHVPATKAKAA